MARGLEAVTKSAGLAVDVQIPGTGTGYWNNPGFVGILDNLYATHEETVALSPAMSQLKCNNFSFDIDAAHEIQGIEVSFIGHCNWTTVVYPYKASLIVNDVYVSTLEFSPAQLRTIDTTHTAGGPTSLWSVSPTVSQINSSLFGVAIYADWCFKNRIAYIDQVKITVYLKICQSGKIIIISDDV